MEQVAFAAGVLLLFAFMVWVHVRLARRAWTYHTDIHDLKDEEGSRDDDSNAMREFLTEWLQNPRIVQTMWVSATATREALQTTQLAIPAMSAHQIRSTCKALLRDRNVRRVIAVEFMKAHNIPKSQHASILAGLAEYAQLEPQRTGIRMVETA